MVGFHRIERLMSTSTINVNYYVRLDINLYDFNILHQFTHWHSGIILSLVLSCCCRSSISFGAQAGPGWDGCGSCMKHHEIYYYMKWYLEICCFATDIVSDYTIVNFGLSKERWFQRAEDLLRGSGGPNGCSADTGLFDWEITWSYLEPENLKKQEVICRSAWPHRCWQCHTTSPSWHEAEDFFWLCFFFGWEWFFASQNMVHHQFNICGLRRWCQETCKPKQLWRWSYAQISQIKGRIKILPTTEHNEEESWRHDIFIVFQSFSVQFFFKLLMLCEVSALLAGDAFLSEAKNQQLPTHSPFWSQG